MSTCLLWLVVLGGLATRTAHAGVTMTNIGSFSIAGTAPASGLVGWYGNAVAFVPAGQDSINQDTLIITWAQTDPVNTTRRLFLFQRITIVGNNGTPTILCTATLPSDVSIAGTPIGSATGGTRDLVYDPVTRKVVGSMTVSGNRLFAFDLFSTDVTLSNVSYSAATGDSQSFSETFFLTNDGRYTSFYKTSSTNWRKISIGRNQLDGVTAWTKVDVPTTSFTGWYPDPAAYQYNTDSFCCTGGAGFYGSTAVLIRSFKNSANSSYQECRLYAVGQTMDAAAINGYMDLGAVPGMTNGSYIGYGMAFDRATGKTYIRSGFTNNSGSTGSNRIFMVTLTSSCDTLAPDPVTNLAAGGIEPRALVLSWTAPSDPSGILDGAASYDVRYSTAPIDDTNWDAATQVTGEPQPSSAGSTDSVRISGLTAAVDYYFAVRSTDTCGNVSALSTVSARTQDPDVTPPAVVTDLSQSDLHPNSLVLHWSATGDDGMTGLATSYDLRYSLSPITDANFAAATPITVAAPKAPGSAESLEMHNLTAGVTYYFAIKVIDEWPNASAISNILVVPMPAADASAPSAIADLRVTGCQASKAYLKWTAPADVGSAGIARYEIRYSTTPIDETNWAAATLVPNPPAVAAAGTAVSTIVSGLLGNTTYYFAVKSIDWAEPANVSPLSNVASGTTPKPVLPVAVKNPWLTNDRVADTHNLNAMAATYINAYTPNGVVAPASNQDKAINIYNNQKRRLYHWADQPPNVGGNDINDPTYLQNVFGWALCGRHASNGCTIAAAAGFGQRKIAVPGDWQMEFFYDGGWHLFHTMITFYVYTRGTNPHIASCDEIQADNNLVLNAVAEGRACPGFLLCPDSATWEADAVNHYSDGGTGVVATKWTGNMDLHIGETFDRTWEAWQNQHPTPVTDADGSNIVGPDAPYHHDCHNDWKDYVNYPYWEPYGKVIPYIHTTKATYRRWANGTYELRPDFTSQAYKASLDPSSTSVASFADDGLTPNLHPSAANTTANAIFKITLPFYLTDATISGSFYKKTTSDVCKLYFSSNGTTWTQVWDNTTTGSTQLNNLSLRSSIFGKFDYYWIKVELKGVAAKNDAGVDNLVINTIFEHNKGATAYLDKGVNNITVTFDNAAELAASGAAFKVTYKWKEYDGTGWTIDKTHEQYVLTSPTTFTITTGGTKVPRTESIKMEVGEPPFDPEAPAPVTDLVAEDIDAGSVNLTWTATGDNDMQGQASLYDIRYALSPIVDDATWAAATQVTGEPSPAASGTVEHFAVTGLQASTRYYFAMKVGDKIPNWSGLSNCAVVRTPDPDIIPPTWVGNLVARPSRTGASVDLTWTATGDDETTGTAKTYYLRYSTSPIAFDDGGASWNAATPVSGLPAPKVGGSAETFTVTGLTGGTQYYFALKVADERPNLSEVSNCASAVASVLGETVLQYGVNGYIGCQDSYTQSSAATTNYGSMERMRVTGYADLGDTQRGYIKFDLTGIPAGTVIRSAKLSLYSYDVTKMNGSSGFYAAHRITRAWNASTITYNIASTGVNWTTPGGDFDATADALSPKKAAKVPSWYEWDLTARVQEWINAPASNFGWLIKAQNETSHLQDQFYQSDTASAEFRPKLIVSDYVAPVRGDISGDSAVDVEDLLYFVDSFGAACQADRNYNPLCDFNSDGSVDVIDLLTFVQEYWPQ